MSEPLPESADELIENFELFDDWEDRYAYLIDLGKRLPEMPASLKTDENKVRGCMSQVWFAKQDDAVRLRWLGDSDAAIVRGLVAVLHVLYDDRSFDEAAAVDVEKVFDQIGLGGHLSMNRRNGFFAMVERLRAYAAA